MPLPFFFFSRCRAIASDSQADFGIDKPPPGALHLAEGPRPMDLAPGISTADPEREIPSAEPERINPALFARNMAAFAKLTPALHEKLSRISRPQSTLVPVASGGYDIEMGGVYLYDGSHSAYARRRVEGFFMAPQIKTRIEISPPDSQNLDSHAGKCAHDLMKRAVQDYGITFGLHRTTKECHHMVVLGVGLAAQIPLLVQRTNCRHLILVEPNIEFLYHSFHVFDWSRFFKSCISKGCRINFISDISPQIVTESLRSLIRSVNSPAVDGTYIYIAHSGSFLETVAVELARTKDLLLTGLGFLEDERDMIWNSHQNLVDYRGKFVGPRDVVLPIPAFVIASGPSLDKDIDFIRANADRALIISCGTSMRILLKNGIRPDFHMEMENVPVIYDVISKSAEMYSLKGTTLVATTTINPRVKSLFDRTIFYIRPGIASWPMFTTGKDCTLSQASPMVSNLGLSFAQHVGAKTIYLFGVDCGARDPARHHSVDAPYEDGEIEFSGTLNQPVPANFGGTIYSEGVYLWSRNELQTAILNHVPHLIHYNCSDGIRIDGATPKLSRVISLPPRDKAAIIEQIHASYPDYTREQFDKAWTNRNQVRAVLEFRNRLLDAIKSDPKINPVSSLRRPREYPLAFLPRVIQALMPPREADNSPEYHYFRGTIFLATIAMYFYHGRITNPRKRPVFVRLIRERLIALINEIADYVLAFYRELDPDKIARDEEEAADLLAPKTESKPRPAQGRKKPGKRPRGARKRPHAAPRKSAARRLGKR